MPETTRVPTVRRRLWLGGLVAFGIALAVVLGRLPAAQAGGPIQVDTTLDEMTVNGKCSLREAVEAANTHALVDTCAGQAGDNIIILPPTIYVLSILKTGPNDNTSGNLNLTSNIILGPNFCGGICFSTIISGGPGWDDQIIGVSNNARVTLTQLIIQGGNSAVDGGGVGVAGSTLVITDTTLHDNRAARYGGGLFSSVSNMMVFNSRVISNSADWGGGVHSSGARIELHHLLVMSNTALENGGGGVVIRGGAALTMTDSTLRGNVGYGFHGGGLQGYLSTISLANTTVTGNSTTDDGGGIYMLADRLTLNNVTIAHNTADLDHDGEGSGGGIAANGVATVTIANSILALNADLSGGPPHPDCTGTLTSKGYNLIQNTAGCTITGVTEGNRLGLDPLLLPLVFTANSWMHPLHFLSPAIDAGRPGTNHHVDGCITHDQRGQMRPIDGDGDSLAICDMGAYEVQVPTVIQRLRVPLVRR